MKTMRLSRFFVVLCLSVAQVVIVRASHDGSGDPLDWLRDSIPGEPGVDYPILSRVEASSFSCVSRVFGGYYADVEMRCQAYHVCLNDEFDNINGDRKISFLCPNGTVFNQALFTCDWWFNVDCTSAEADYRLNEQIGISEADSLATPQRQRPRRPVADRPSPAAPSPAIPTPPRPSSSPAIPISRPVTSPTQRPPVQRPKPTSQRPRPTQTAPTQPRPTRPRPTEPAPTRPRPTQPAPTRPTQTPPTQPRPTRPRPTQTRPARPRPTQARPISPLPTQPRPTRPPTRGPVGTQRPVNPFLQPQTVAIVSYDATLSDDDDAVDDVPILFADPFSDIEEPDSPNRLYDAPRVG